MAFKVLSLFDGCAGARQALDNLGVECEYYASEIDKYAIQIAMKNYPDIIQLGDITQLDPPKSIDLLIGGSPCQDLSRAKHGEGLQGEKSSLFYSYLDILKEVKPKYFILENVASMTNANKAIISELLEVEPVRINSKHFTAQNRERLYWTNFSISIPDWTGPKLSRNMVAMVERRSQKAKEDRKRIRKLTGKDYSNFRDKILVERTDKLANCVTATVSPNMQIKTKEGIRFLTPIECERLQGMKDNYTEGVSNTQRYKMIGNGFTIPVIEHILKGIL